FYTYAAPGGGQVVPDEQTPTEAPSADLSAVGVVGTGELADELVSRLQDGGYAVTRVEDPADRAELARLADVGLVVEAQAPAPPPSEEELADAEAWVEATGEDL